MGSGSACRHFLYLGGRRTVRAFWDSCGFPAVASAREDGCPASPEGLHEPSWRSRVRSSFCRFLQRLAAILSLRAATLHCNRFHQRLAKLQCAAAFRLKTPASFGVLQASRKLRAFSPPEGAPIRNAIINPFRDGFLRSALHLSLGIGSGCASFFRLGGAINSPHPLRALTHSFRIKVNRGMRFPAEGGARIPGRLTSPLPRAILWFVWLTK